MLIINETEIWTVICINNVSIKLKLKSCAYIIHCHYFLTKMFSLCVPPPFFGLLAVFVFLQPTMTVGSARCQSVINFTQSPFKYMAKH